MRDDDERAVPARERLLELLDRLEVAVVRRLVEHEQIGLDQQERRERGPRRLASGEAVERPVEVEAEPERRAGRRRPRVEIAAADAVRPDQPDARAGTDLERRVLEDDLCSVGLRDAGEASTRGGTA